MKLKLDEQASAVPKKEVKQKKFFLQRCFYGTLISTFIFPALVYAENYSKIQNVKRFRTEEFYALGGLGMIHADEAYAQGYTGRGIRVAVLDSSYMIDHAEFLGRINTTPLPWSDVLKANELESDDHSTMVAGVIAAARDNKIMHGVAYEAQIIPINHFSYYSGVLKEFYEKNSNHHIKEKVDEFIKNNPGPIYLAVNNGAQVINMSYGYSPYPTSYESQTVQRYPINGLSFDGIYPDITKGLRYAAEHDVVVVTSAGNEFQQHPQAAAHPITPGLLPYIKPSNHHTGVYEFVENENSYDPSMLDPEHPSHLSLFNSPPLDPNDPRLQSLDYSDLEGILTAVVAVGPDKKIASYSNRCGVAWRWCMAAPGGDIFAETEALQQQWEDNKDEILSRVETLGLGSLSETELKLFRIFRQPGINTATSNGQYDFSAGTSFAAPFVAGTAALVRQAFPYMTAPQITEILRTTADRSGHLADRAIYGRGLVNAGRAVRGPAEFGAEGFAAIFDVNTGGYDSWWYNDISGIGGFTKRGLGALTLMGMSTYTGPTTIRGGRLVVNGSIAQSALTIEREATLSGTGTVGPTHMMGTIAPTHPGQPLHVVGDYLQDRQGVYIVKVGATDSAQSDQIHVEGMAQLDQAMLELKLTPNLPVLHPNTLNHRYTILHAEAGIQGGFAPLPPYTFLETTQGISANDPTRYEVSLLRNRTAFTSVAKTPNQYSVANALNHASLGFAPYDATIMTLQGQEDALAQQFDRWSGEAHVSVLSSLARQTAGLVREAALKQSRSMSSSLSIDDMTVSAVASQKSDEAAQKSASTSANMKFWGQYTGSTERNAGDSHSSALQARYSGLLVGANASITPSTQLGAMISFNHGNLDLPERYSHAKMDSRTLGAYSSHQFEGLRGSYGASYSWHTISAQRDTGSLGIAKSRYHAATAQVFAEVGLPLQLTRTQLEPYMGLAYLQTQRDAFEESSTAGLQAQVAKQKIGLSTLGLRANHHWMLKEGLQLKLYGATGWQRALGHLQPSAQMQFAQGEHFEVYGGPLARNTLLLEAGIGLESLSGLRLGAAITSQLARGAQTHAMKANISWQF